MRRTASEVLKNLEMRVARLERQASLYHYTFYSVKNGRLGNREELNANELDSFLYDTAYGKYADVVVVRNDGLAIFYTDNGLEFEVVKKVKNFNHLNRVARLERQSSVDASFLDDVAELGEYPEIDDIDNIVEAVEEMMTNRRVTTADLDKALDELYNLQGRSLDRQSSRTLEKALDILED